MSRATIRFTILAVVCFASVAAVAGEGREPIYQDPTNIVNSGKYIVTRDIQGVSGLPIIDVQAPNVDIDLNGFTLIGSPGVSVIRALNQDNVTLRNGTIIGGQIGIEIGGGGNFEVVIEDVKVIDSAGFGIRITGQADIAIRRAKVRGSGNAGISVDGAGFTDVQGTIEDCQVELCGGGIHVIAGSSFAILRNRVENVTLSAAVLCPAGIIYDVSVDGLIAENTVDGTKSGAGICLGDTRGTKLYNNVVSRSEREGIYIAGFSNDNLLIENVVTESAGDGVAVEGSRNFIDRNLLNSNGTSGSGHGLHFYAIGGQNNTYGRNTARGSPGGPCIPPPGPFNTPDFCDDTGGANDSFGDNYIPGPPLQ